MHEYTTKKVVGGGNNQKMIYLPKRLTEKYDWKKGDTLLLAMNENELILTKMRGGE